MLILGWITAACLLTVVGCDRASRPGAKGEAPMAASEQRLTPVRQIDTWLDGMHVMKSDTDRVMEVQHYCDVVDDDLIQCLLYDRTGPKARLVGVEYVVSERLFNGLSDREQSYWHPHNYEVLSGMLVAPSMPNAEEKALMGRLLNTYGKSWHTWDVGLPGHAGPELPLGDPRLGWSFNADNEAPADMVSARNRRLGVDMEQVRERRRSLVELAHPQDGVNALEHAFPERRTIPGVRERGGGPRGTE